MVLRGSFCQCRRVGKVRVKAMVIQNNKISPALRGTDQVQETGVPVQNARDGRVSNDILDITMDCAVPGRTENSTVYTEAQAKQIHKNSTVELAENSGISPADFISRCMTGEDAKALSDEETPLEDYTSSQLERAVSRVKEQRSEKRQAVSEQVEQEREEEKAREEAAVQSAAETGVSDSILKQLQESGLPLTSDHAERLTHAVSLTAQRHQFSPASMEFFVRGRLDITPENISGSVYGSSAGRQNSRGSAPVEEQGFELVKGQVEDILAEGGLAVTEESMKTAAWLYRNELPVTVENIRLCGQLEELQELDDETLLGRIVDNLLDGVPAERADLTKLSYEEASCAIRQLTETQDGALRRVYTTEADYISAKRQLEEIRLSMTIEAARSMSARGINLDISNLEKIVEELRAKEQQAKESLLAETGLPLTEENAERMADTIQAAKNVLTAPAGLLGTAMATGGNLTLAGLSERASEQKDQFARMEQTYEAVGTEVRRDLGDSLNKAFGNINEILEDLGMETTGMNQRAVRILAYNQMPLTNDNIHRMKEYDDRVTTLMKDLKPPVVAELIRKNINPLDISLEELDSAVSEIRENIVDEDISFRRFLWKMDHQGNLTEDERNSMIGVYRLLDKIEKSDGAAIGKVIKEGRELSLSSLLSATRTRKAEGLNLSIDDEFGGLEDTVRTGMTIDEQIRAAYGSSVVGKLQKDLSPKVLRENVGDIMEMPLEELLEICRAEGETGSEMEPYFEEIAERMRLAMEDSEGQIRAFLDALSMPDSAANRMMAMEYMAGGLRDYAKLWKRSESDAVCQAFGNPDELEEIYGQIDQAHENDLSEKKKNDDITYSDALSMAKMAGGISFYQNLRSCQTYEVPVVTERGVTACHVTIRNGDGRKGTVEISMDSEQFGKVQATFRVSGVHVRGFVTVEQQENMELCQELLAGFEKDLEESGFTMDSESLVRGSRRSLHKTHDIHADRETGAKNRDLYQIARCFLINVDATRKEDEV